MHSVLKWKHNMDIIVVRQQVSPPKPFNGFHFGSHVSLYPATWREAQELGFLSLTMLRTKSLMRGVHSDKDQRLSTRQRWCLFSVNKHSGKGASSASRHLTTAFNAIHKPPHEQFLRYLTVPYQRDLHLSTRLCSLCYNSHMIRDSFICKVKGCYCREGSREAGILSPSLQPSIG